MAQELEPAIGQKLMEELAGIEELTKDDRQRLMEKYGVSQRTLYNMKKKAVAQKKMDELTAEDKLFLAKNHITIPKRLQGIISEVNYYKAYMQDSEEGWKFYRELGKMQYEGNAVFYVGIVYADSLEELEEMLDRLTVTGMPYCWIWHDKDFWLHDSPEERDQEKGTLIFAKGEKYKKGDLKRYHAHVMLKWGKLVKWEDNQQFVNEIFGLHTVAWQRVGNPEGMYSYFRHDTSRCRADGKYLYPREARISVNGFSVKLNDREKGEVLSGIFEYITKDLFEDYGRYELKDLTTHFLGQLDILGVMRGSANYINGLLMSCRQTTTEEDYEEWWERHPSAEKKKIIQARIERHRKQVAEKLRRKEEQHG